MFAGTSLKEQMLTGYTWDLLLIRLRDAEWSNHTGVRGDYRCKRLYFKDVTIEYREDTDNIHILRPSHSPVILTRKEVEQQAFAVV